MKNVKKIVAFVIAAALVATGYANIDDVAGMWGEPEAKIAGTIAEGEMKVTFLDVGQGDCTLIQADGQNMVLDVGNNDQGERVVSYLKAQGIEKLDYFLLSHPDADHIGGGDNVLENFEVQTVIMPDVANDTMTYQEVMEDISRYDVDVKHPEVGDIFTLGDAEFTILCPEPELISQDDLNNSSIGIKLVHGENSFVLCGDAEEKSEQEMVKRFGASLESDVLKCGHHGSSTATSDAFLEAVDPTWAVISCGKENRYGHPHSEVLDKLENDDVQIYRTDLEGSITAASDGTQITWKCEK